MDISVHKVFIGCIDGVDIIYDTNTKLISFYKEFDVLVEIPYNDAKELNHAYLRYSINKIDTLIGDNSNAEKTTTDPPL
jgi:hypothetical protein